MPGASDRTRRVTNLNANWMPHPGGGDGQFELQIITDDGQQTTPPPALLRRARECRARKVAKGLEL